MDNSFNFKSYMFKMTLDFHKAVSSAAASEGITLQDYISKALVEKMAKDGE